MGCPYLNWNRERGYKGLRQGKMVFINLCNPSCIYWRSSINQGLNKCYKDKRVKVVK